SALHALAIDDGGARAGFSFALLSTLHIKRVMDAIQRAVVAPQVEIVEQCAAWWQVFRDRTPLASRAQNIHNPVHHFAHLDMALVATPLRGRDQRFDMRPFIVGQVTRVSQFAAVVTSAVLRRPHRWCPSRIRSPLLNHKRFKGFKMFSDGHLVILLLAWWLFRPFTPKRPRYSCAGQPAKPVRR